MNATQGPWGTRGQKKEERHRTIAKIIVVLFLLIATPVFFVNLAWMSMLVLILVSPFVPVVLFSLLVERNLRMR